MLVHVLGNCAGGGRGAHVGVHDGVRHLGRNLREFQSFLLSESSHSLLKSGCY